MIVAVSLLHDCFLYSWYCYNTHVTWIFR